MSKSAASKTQVLKRGVRKMYGALLGDMIGAPYEFDMGDKTKEFPLSLRQSA